jgi:hypothetical protein
MNEKWTPISKMSMAKADPVPRKPTMAYSFKASDGNGVAPTESFGAESVSIPAVSVSAPITVPDPKPQPAQTSITAPSLVAPAPYTPPINSLKNLVSYLIEKDVDAWRCLPSETRSILLENADRVELVQDADGKSVTPNIIYGGCEFKYNGDHWMLVKIHKDKL